MFKRIAFSLAFHVLSFSSLASDYYNEQCSSDSSCDDFIDGEEVDEVLIALANRSHQFSAIKSDDAAWKMAIEDFNALYGFPSFNAKSKALDIVPEDIKPILEEYVEDKLTRFYPDDLIMAIAGRAEIFSLDVGSDEWFYVVERFNDRYGYPSARSRMSAMKYLASRQAIDAISNNIMTAEMVESVDYLVEALALRVYPFGKLKENPLLWKSKVDQFNNDHGMPSVMAKKYALNALDDEDRRYFDRKIKSIIIVRIPGKENNNPKPNIVAGKKITGKHVTGEHVRRWEVQIANLPGLNR